MRREHFMQVPEGMRCMKLVSVKRAKGLQLLKMMRFELLMAVARMLMQLRQRDLRLDRGMRQPRDLRMITPVHLMLVFLEIGAEKDVPIVQFDIAAAIREPCMPRHTDQRMLFSPYGFWTDIPAFQEVCSSSRHRMLRSSAPSPIVHATGTA